MEEAAISKDAERYYYDLECPDATVEL